MKNSYVYYLFTPIYLFIYFFDIFALLVYMSGDKKKKRKTKMV